MIPQPLLHAAVPFTQEDEVSGRARAAIGAYTGLRTVEDRAVDFIQDRVSEVEDVFLKGPRRGKVPVIL